MPLAWASSEGGTTETVILQQTDTRNASQPTRPEALGHSLKGNEQQTNKQANSEHLYSCGPTNCTSPPQDIPVGLCVRSCMAVCANSSAGWGAAHHESKGAPASQPAGLYACPAQRSWPHRPTTVEMFGLAAAMTSCNHLHMYVGPVLPTTHTASTSARVAPQPARKAMERNKQQCFEQNSTPACQLCMPAVRACQIRNLWQFRKNPGAGDTP
jgi:hypothetical protein